MTPMRRAAAVLLVATFQAGTAGAFTLPDRFRDPQDGAFDVSEYLLDHRGALPMPIFITEPAVGYGGGLALAWFSESIRDAAGKAREGRLTPPNIYAAAVLGTENGTRGAAVGARLSFDRDRWRYRGAALTPKVNLDFYGIGGTLPALDKVSYSLDGWGTFHELTRRLGESDHFLGLRFLYLDLESNLDAVQGDLAPRDQAHRTSELGFRWVHDSRDNIFFSTRGMEIAVDMMFADPAIGSESTFQTYRTHLFSYTPLGRSVLAVRADARAARGDIPFYQLPFIDMRGIPAARYQDENTGILEAELRWYATPRWIGVAFAGAGRAWGRNASFSDSGTKVTKGVGFRYLVASRLGLAVGLDVARGPEKTAYYIQFGNAWR
jgi:hypothetical protein